MSGSTSAGDGGRHPVEVGHLAMGVAFLGLAGVWGLVTADVVGDDGVAWLLPLPWLAAGLAGVVATVLSARARRRRRAADAARRAASGTMDR